jgi:N6-L-threonylcarbamoyladenine synthase
LNAREAVVDGRRILANVISSQGIHDRYGGVVPEIASRHHLELIDDAVADALRQAGTTLAELDLIASEFERLMAREERRLSVELTTARELTDDEAKAIVAQIEQAAGRTVEATRSVDPDLIGGIVLQAGSYRADASVRGRLERLRQTLVRS